MSLKRSVLSLFGRGSEPEGSDTSPFTLGADLPVSSLLIQADGKILVGGLFNTLCGQKRTRIGRLNPDCTLDAEFEPQADGQVAIALQQDGRILIGESSTPIRRVPMNISRLNSDGSLDPSFNLELVHDSPFDGVIRSLLPLQTTGNIVVRGAFHQKKGVFGRDFNIFILSEDGAILGTLSCGGVDPYDEEFLYYPELKGIVAVAELPDGKLVVGGSFRGLGDSTKCNIGRLNADATIDKGFSAPYLEYITSIVPQEDGKIVVGGYFTEVGHYKAKYLVRLNQDGSLDETHTWNPTADYPITMMISKQDGTIVVLQYSSPNKCSISSLHPYNLRTLSSFVFKINGPDSIDTLAAQEDGRILIGGQIKRFEGQKCSNILRLNPDGTLDTSSA